MFPNMDYEKDLAQKGYKYICSIDEVGVGALSGKATCAAVILPIGLDYQNLLPNINDSKQLTAEQRKSLYPLIKKYALCWAVDFITLEEINTLNIYWAKMESFRRVIKKLSIAPDYILVDGNKTIPNLTIPQSAIVKGDTKCVSIASASILAKCDRDDYIQELSKQVHSDYGWFSNKGYYTKKHIEAIKKHGKTQWHRDKYVEKFL